MKASSSSAPEDLVQGLAAAVVDVLELAVLVLQLEVVPVLAAQEHTGIAVLQFEVMDALEDLRERFPTLEVQVAVVGGLGKSLAAVVHTDQVLVRLGGRPAGPDRQRRVEGTFDFPDVERSPQRPDAASEEARLTANGNRARRENGLRVVIDATPCVFFVMSAWTIASAACRLIPRKCDLRGATTLARAFAADGE